MINWVKNSEMQYHDKFKTETGLISRYTEDKAFLVWAMGLYLDVQDLESMADDNLTDNGDDHGVDFLRYDEDAGTLYLAQGYHTNKVKQAAPAAKAADLNAACAWLIKGEIDKFHPDIRENVIEARDAILAGNVQKIVLIYLHNCGESLEVRNELDTAKQTCIALLDGSPIEVVPTQLGNESLERLFQNQAANIIVTDTIECPFPVRYTETTGAWNAAVLTVSGQWLREQYKQYSGDLFSANYRGFLGNSRQKINNGIKATAERAPKNFWAFNNGITLLTTQIRSEAGKTILSGVSIINGAQTTGSLGAVSDSVDLSETKILTRIIECSDPETINSIVKFNNTQNKITAWDSFSNDPIQIQLQEEFKALGHNYNIKRGFSNRDSLLSVEAALQPMLALAGKYKDANRSKTYLFESRSLYTDAFEHRGARNLLFACCLNTCLQVIKSENKEFVESGASNVTDSDKKIRNVLAVIKFKYYIMAIIAESLHQLVNTLLDPKRISFMPVYAKAANHNYSNLVSSLKPIVKLMLPIIVNELGDDFYSKYNDSTTVVSIANKVETSLNSLRAISSDVQANLNGIASLVCNG